MFQSMASPSSIAMTDPATIRANTPGLRPRKFIALPVRGSRAPEPMVIAVVVTNSSIRSGNWVSCRMRGLLSRRKKGVFWGPVMNWVRSTSFRLNSIEASSGILARRA